MHVENKLVEFVTVGEQEYLEVIEEYKEEVLVHPGHSVRPNRSVQFLGHSVSSVIRNLGPIGLCKK